MQTIDRYVSRFPDLWDPDHTVDRLMKLRAALLLGTLQAIKCFWNSGFRFLSRKSSNTGFVSSSDNLIKSKYAIVYHVTIMANLF